MARALQMVQIVLFYFIDPSICCNSGTGNFFACRTGLSRNAVWTICRIHDRYSRCDHSAAITQASINEIISGNSPREDFGIKSGIDHLRDVFTGKTSALFWTSTGICGIFLVSGTMGSLIHLGCLILYLPLGIYFEEKNLISLYGERYREYKKEVPPFFPKIHKKRG